MKSGLPVISLMWCLASAAMAGDIPDELHVVMGGFLGPSYEIQLANGVLSYKAAENSSQLRKTVAISITPTEAQWKAFRKTLDEIDVWSWKPAYENSRILDGTQWLLRVKYGEKALSSRGNNAYPGGKGPAPSEIFKRLLRAITDLLSGRPFK